MGNKMISNVSPSVGSETLQPENLSGNDFCDKKILTSAKKKTIKVINKTLQLLTLLRLLLSGSNNPGLMIHGRCGSNQCTAGAVQCRPGMEGMVGYWGERRGEWPVRKIESEMGLLWEREREEEGSWDEVVEDVYNTYVVYKKQGRGANWWSGGHGIKPAEPRPSLAHQQWLSEGSSRYSQ